MEFKQRDGADRVFIYDLAELSALRTIVRAFARYAHQELAAEVSEDAMDSLDNTVRSIDDATTLAISVRAQTRIDGPNTTSFGEPYLGFIRMAVATFEQRPDLLEPLIEEDELLGAQTFFPPAEPTQT